MADAPEWATSDTKPAWATAPAVETAPAWAAPAPAPEAEQPSTLKSIGSNVAAIGDIVAGTPAWVAKMGQTGIADIAASVAPDTDYQSLHQPNESRAAFNLRTARESTEENWKDEKFLQAPLQTTFGVNQENTATGKMMGKFGGWIDSLAESASQSAGSSTAGEIVKQGSNIVMAKAADILTAGAKGAKATAKIAERLKSGKVGEPPAPSDAEVAANLKAMGKTPQKVDSTPNQKPEILAGKRKTAQLNPEGEGPITGDPLESDLSSLDRFNPTFEDENYIKSVLADPELHNAEAGPAHEIAAEKVALTVKDRVASHGKFDFAKDMLDETKALSRLAKHKGYENVDDFAKNHPEEFKATTEKWRAEHPIPKDVTKVSAKEAEVADEKLHNVPIGQRGAIGEVGKPSIEDIAGLYGTGIEKRHGERATVSQLDKLKGQTGKIDTRLASRIAGTLGGAAIGYAIDKDDPIEGAVMGGLGGFMAAGMSRTLYEQFSVRSLKDAFDVVKPSVDPMRAQAAEAGFKNQGAIAATLRNVDAVAISARKAISAKRLDEIGVLVSAGKLDKLTPDELVYVKAMSQELARLGMHAQEAGVIPHLLPPSKYGVPLIWDFGNKTTKELFDKFLASGAGETPSASGYTPFSMRRQGPNYEQGIALGMKPKTTNMADLLSIYAKSVVRATENAKTLSQLKALKVSPENYAVEPIGKGMPKEYVINHGIGGLEGFGVHPEMVEPLKIAFDSYSPGLRGRAMLTLAFGAKRILMSYSGFHASSLTTAYAAAMGNPALIADVALGAAARGAEKVGEKVAGKLTGKKMDFQYKIPYMSGIDKAIKAYQAGGNGDIYDFAVRNGLKAGPGMEDINGRDAWKKFMDSAIPGASKIDNAAHSFTFGYIYVGAKLDLFRAKFESELLDPKNAGVDVNTIARDVASFANTIEGGLNMPRIIEGMRSKLGRALAQDTLSKRGLATAQLGLLAPDWFYSTLRAWTQAIPGVSESARVGRLHRGYIVNGVLMTMAISDGINYTYSGHHIWENDFRTDKEKKKKENPTLQERLLFMTRTDLGDGRYMSLNKHLFEFIHMVTAPAEFASGKLSPMVSDPMAILQNKQWNNLSSKWAPKVTDGGTTGEVLMDEAKYLASKHAPIGFQQGLKGNFSGIGGFPISGMKPEDLANLREKAKEERQKRKEEAGE